MRLRVKHSAFVMLLLSLLVSRCLWAANNANSVEVDRERLTVHVRGITLAELLVSVSEVTGVEFVIDGRLTRVEVSVDFQRLTFSEGIKKIIHSLNLNFATVADASGNISKVFIFSQGTASVTLDSRQRASGAMEEATNPRSDEITPHATEDPATHQLANGPPAGDEPADSEAPPVGKIPGNDGPPEAEYRLSDGPPSIVIPDHSPPLNSATDTLDGPPRN
jgi:hypothetical protein